MFAAALIFVLVSLAVLLIGFLIKHKGMTSLIAGYDASRVRDEKGLAGWVGSGVMSIGIVGIVIGGLIYVLPMHVKVLAISFAVLVVGTVVILVSGVRRFLK